MHLTRRALTRAVLVVGGAALVTSCTSSAPKHTGDSTAATVKGIEQVTIKAGNNLRFTPSTITVHTGQQVRVTLVNTGTAPHNWTLPQFGADYVPTTQGGATNSKLFIAPLAGTYQFVCTIHEKEGQVGKLVVLPN